MVKIDIQFFGGGSSGGKGKGMKKAATPQTQTAAAAAPANTATANQTFQQRQQAFYDMDAQEFENYLDKVVGNDIQMPADYFGMSFQKMVYDLGMNDKPTVMDSKSFDNYLKANPDAQVLYRGVVGNVAISAESIAEQLKYSDGTHVGGGYYGDGLYFSGSTFTANEYSRNSNGDGAIIRAALAPDAKVISRNDLNKLYASLPSSTRQKLKAAGKQSSWGNDGESHLALKLGFDALEGAEGDHLIILNRKALICDSQSYIRHKQFNPTLPTLPTAPSSSEFHMDNINKRKLSKDYSKAKKNQIFGALRYQDNFLDL